MAQTRIYYRLRIRDEADASDIIVLSSHPDATNALLCEAPDGEGQNIDPLAGTCEVGSYTWQAADRYDGGDTYTITSILADTDARNQLLSHKCVGEYSPDGTTWSALHTGYLNDIKLGDAATYTFIVGDTDRRERDSKLFKVITDTFDRVSNIIGGPVEADPPVAYQGTATRAWGPIIDYGPVRMQVIANPSGLVDSTNRITLSLVGGNLPPRYLGFQGEWNGKIPNPAEYIDQLAYQYYEAAVDPDDGSNPYATDGSQQSQPWGSFPSLEVKLTKVSDSSVIKSFPIAQATRKASSYVTYPGGSIDWAVGDEQALVANSNDWLIVAWDVGTMGAQPSVGTAYDVLVRPKVISEDNPLHLAGHPIDLHIAANTELDIPYDSASAATVKTALGDLWYELRITGEQEYSKFTEMLKGSAGYGIRYNADAEQEFFAARATQPSSVATITTADLLGDDHGEPQDVIFRVAESTAIKGVDFKLTKFRLWSAALDSDSDRKADGIVANDLTITGTRRDADVKTEKIQTYEVPGMILLAGDAVVLNQPFALREWIEAAGDVIIDRAGWGWMECEYEVLDTVAGEVGDYHDLEAPHQVNAKTGQDPITQRGGTRKVQIVSVTRTPGAKKIKARDAGNLAQDPPEAPDAGAGLLALPVPELTLAASVDNPTTIATVTETNVSELQDINADTELQYLVQTATPASTDNGDPFGPLLSSTGADTIDAPAILSGETIWVRGRATIVALGQVSDWSAWISITLGPDDDGTEGALPPFLLALSIDSSGVLSAEATSTDAAITKVYFLAGAAGGSAPLYADVIAETPDSSGPPFTAASLATMAEGETRTVGAVGEDDLGNRTLLVTASITRAVNTGAGEGTPGNQTVTLIAGPPSVVWNVGATLREPRAFEAARKYWNTANVARARVVQNCWTPANDGAELHWAYSLDGGATVNESGVFVRCDREKRPEVGDFLEITAADAIGDNILFTLAVKNGDGLATLKTSDAFIETVSSDTPPDSPPPGAEPIDIPSGGALGTIVLNLDARQLTENPDLTALSEWLDISGFSHHAEILDLFAEGATFYEDHFGDGSPSMGFNTGGPVTFNGINTGDGFAFTIPDQNDFTYYLVGGDFEGLGSDDKNWANASLLNNHAGSSNPDFGSSMRADGKIAFGVGENSSVATAASRKTANAYNGSRRDIHTFARRPSSGSYAWYVNGTSDTPSGGNSTGADLTTNPYVGLMYGGGGHFAKGWIQHVICYDTVHSQAQIDIVVAALNAIWIVGGGGGGGGGGTDTGGDGGTVPPGGGGDTGGAGFPAIRDLKGFGTATPAGRGGTLYRVTNLNDSGAGSLRAALEATGPRVVCFEVSGTIDLSSKIAVTSPYLTIAGQTAPSPGISIKRYGISVRTHDILIQHIRARTGDLAVVGNNDPIEILGPNAYNVVVDHSSTSWSTDENMSTWFTGTETESSGAHDITFNRCIVSENFGSGGMLLGDYTQRVSVLSCLLAHNVDRNPYFKGAVTGVFVNNVVYDWNGNQASYIADPENRGRTLAAIVGNVYKRGLSTDSGRPIKIYVTAKPGTQLYVTDNRDSGVGGGTPPGDPWTLVQNDFGSSAVAASAPVWPDGLVAIASSGVQADVLGDVGAYAAFYDSVDTRIVADVTAGTGTEISSQSDVGGFPSLANNTRTLESAGMPADTTTDTDADGYTDFEDWLAMMAAAVE